MKWIGLVWLLLVMPGYVAAQDSTNRVVLGTEYRPGMRPGLVVLPTGPALDSVRAILERDLDYSDRFELISLRRDAGDPAPADSVNYKLYETLGATFALQVQVAGSNVVVRLHHVGQGQVRVEETRPLDLSGVGESRMAVHRLADEIVRWGTGTQGIAATRILFVANGRIYRVDSDGAGVVPMTPAGRTALSPAWAPDGSAMVYVELQENGWSIFLERFATGTRSLLPSTGTQTNITPVFSPEGRYVVFAQSGEAGTNLFRVNVAELCCVERLTAGPFADNLSPAYSPEGRRLAFVSTRAGAPQIYEMAADGTQQELLVPFDYGATGSSNAPDWSPDGAYVAFHRETQRTPQVWVYDVGRRVSRQLTSSGRNEDPSWGPDGRHIVFVSDRAGVGQLFVMDFDTGRIRQIRTPGPARLPAWSRSLTR